MSFTQPGLPGTYITFEGAAAPVIVPSSSDVVAIPLISDWGPIGVDAPGTDGLQGGAQELTTFDAYTGLYGDSDTAGRTAVAGALAGQGLAGAPGAGAVIVWRMAGTGAARATVTLNEIAATPALQLDAYYIGSRGNRVGYTVDNNPSNAAQDRLRIYFDGVVQEVYIFNPATGTMATLAAQIAARSRLVKPTALVPSGVARLVQHTSLLTLTGGLDGSAPASADHLAALAGLQYKSFGLIVPYDLTDSAILASYVSWIEAELAASRPRRLVVGGVAGESTATAITRAASINDPHVITLGSGTYHDDLLGKDLSTSQLAPRIAGILAARGEEHSITFAKIGGLHVVLGPTDDEVQLAVDGGVVVLVPTSAPDADLHIEQGVTSYIGNTTAQPKDVFGDARLVGIMDNFVANMREWADEKVIGALPVNDDSRTLVYGQARAQEDDLQRRGLILPPDPAANPPIPAPFVNVVDTDANPALADTIPFTFGWQFAKTANAIIGQGSVS